MVFQIMQVVSAPLIAVVSYHIFEPSSRSVTIALAFASGFASETVLLAIRAFIEKITPETSADPKKGTHVSATPARLEFGDVKVGDSVTKSVGITNPTSVELTITTVNASGEFQVAANIPQKVAAGSSAAVEVTFTPRSTGEKIGVLTITDNAIGSPRAVDLTGKGIEASTMLPPSMGQQRPQDENDT